MGNKQESGFQVYPLFFGEKFIYDPPSRETVGGAALSKKDGSIYARAGVYLQEDEPVVMIASNNIFTGWDARTGMITSMAVQPMLKALYLQGLPVMHFSFDTMEPFLSAQKLVSDIEFTAVENGLVYDGRQETGVIMEYGKYATIAGRLTHTSLRVWLEWEQHVNRIVVESKPGIVEWVRYKRSIDPKTVIELFTQPRIEDPTWRAAVTDEAHKLRYQVIESNGY